MEWDQTCALLAIALAQLATPEPKTTACHASLTSLCTHLMITVVIAFSVTLTTHTSQVDPQYVRLAIPHVPLALQVLLPIVIAASVVIFSTHLTTTAEHALLPRPTSLVVLTASHANLLAPPALLEHSPIA